jgi:hypothetical protein
MSKQQPKTPPPAEAVAAAEEILAKLQAERQELAGRIPTYEQSAERLAFKARAQHDAEASRELQAARDEVVNIRYQLGEYDHAIAEAGRQLKAAHHRVDVEAERERAGKLRQSALDLKELAPQIDECLHDLETFLSAWQVGCREMRSHGTTLPSDMQVAACWRVIALTLSRTLFARAFETTLTAPERQSHSSFTKVTDGWTDAAIKQADQVMQATDQTNKAA